LIINLETTCTTNQDCYRSIEQTQLQLQIISIHHNTIKRLIKPYFLKLPLVDRESHQTTPTNLERPNHGDDSP